VVGETDAPGRAAVAGLPPPPIKPAGIARARQPLEKLIEVRRGDTLLSIFVEAGLNSDEAKAAVSALKPVFRPKDLQVGQMLTLLYEPVRAGYASRLASIHVDAEEKVIHLTRDAADRFTAKPVDKPLTVDVAHARSPIRGSLFQTGKRSGVPLPVMTDVIQAFSFDVDFQRELQPGDQFEVLYERLADEQGKVVKHRDMLFASLQLGDRTLAVYRFTTADGETTFYDRTGESIRKALLRTPIDGAQVTSGFGMRKHPILGYSKMHKGLDFGAPTGTPIFAAGAGTIVEIGPNGSYGKYVRIRHNAQYQTAYAHASRFAKGMKVGKKVKQGDIIAYVGTTGRSTGPHLHYEVMVDGKQSDPLSLKLVGRKLQGAELKRFQALVAAIDKMRNGGSAERVLIAARP
jgi:murein DD-endopeptidase MepM/ murein hydrolase activator NlpD